MAVISNNILAGASGQTGGAAAGYEIERSLRFNPTDGAYLSRPVTASNRRTYTFSFWAKLCDISSNSNYFFTAGPGSAGGLNSLEIGLNNNNQLFISEYGATLSDYYIERTEAYHRDPSAWYHFVIAVDTTQTAATDRIRFYVNGVEQVKATTSYPFGPSQETAINSSSTHTIGSDGVNSLNAYLADIHFIDGQALAVTDFGEVDADTGVWNPIQYTGSYPGNSFHLDFGDSSSTTTIAEDSSGNGNDWTANNISVTAGAGNDSLFDSPTNGDPTLDTGLGGELSGNYATMSPNIGKSNYDMASLSNGNLQVDWVASRVAWSDFGLTSGKWYYETTLSGGVTSGNGTLVRCSRRFSTSYNSFFWRSNGGTSGLSSSPTFSSYTAGDVLGVAIDVDNEQVTFYKNGTVQGAGAYSYTSANGEPIYIGGYWNYNDNTSSAFNFGQRPWEYSAPSGYKALCTANLTDPTIADGSTAMDVVQYPGDGVSETVTGLEFGPDLVWIKVKDSVRSHFWFDTVRGAENYILSDPDVGGVEVNDTTTLTSFTSDGFSVGSSVDVNRNTSTIVAWTWDAGGAPTTDNVAGAGNVPTAGSVKIDGANSTTALAGSIAATRLSANTSTGFSIVKFTMGSGSYTVAHGLGQEPALVITKILDSTGNWFVFMDSTLGTSNHLYLNKPDIPPTVARTASSSSTLAVDNSFHANGNKYIKYCWAPVEGYSAFGSYEGNVNVNGPFVYTGFRPRFVLVKSADLATSWQVYDTERNAVNLVDNDLFPDLSDIENNPGVSGGIDFLSNGFKIRSDDSWLNSAGSTPTYVWAAFAESPFKYARAR